MEFRETKSDDRVEDAAGRTVTPASTHELTVGCEEIGNEDDPQIEQSRSDCCYLISSPWRDAWHRLFDIGDDMSVTFYPTPVPMTLCRGCAYFNDREEQEDYGSHRASYPIRCPAQLLISSKCDLSGFSTLLSPSRAVRIR